MAQNRNFQALASRCSVPFFIKGCQGTHLWKDHVWRGHRSTGGEAENHNNCSRGDHISGETGQRWPTLKIFLLWKCSLLKILKCKQKWDGCKHHLLCFWNTPYPDEHLKISVACQLSYSFSFTSMYNIIRLSSCQIHSEN